MFSLCLFPSVGLSIPLGELSLDPSLTTNKLFWVVRDNDAIFALNTENINIPKVNIGLYEYRGTGGC